MKRDITTQAYHHLTLILACSIGCASSFFIQKYFEIPAYWSSAIVGLMGSFIPRSEHYDNKKLTAALYAGSFALMTRLSYFLSLSDLFVLCLLTGFFFIILSRFFRGFGGKLGTIGFFASFSFILIKEFL